VLLAILVLICTDIFVAKSKVYELDSVKNLKENPLATPTKQVKANILKSALTSVWFVF